MSVPPKLFILYLCFDFDYPDCFFRGFISLREIRVGHYATSRKVAGSIPDEVIGFFN
jgi:hypothetical protein